MPILPIPFSMNIITLFVLWNSELTVAIKIAVTVLVTIKFALFLVGVFQGKKLLGSICILSCAAIGVATAITCFAVGTPTVAALLSVTVVALVMWCIFTKYFSEWESRRA